MKLGTLVNEGFVASLNELNKKELPGAIAYRVGKISTKAAEEQKEYFKLRSEIIKKYTKTNEDGSNKVVERDGKTYLDFGDDVPKLDQELQDLGNQEVAVPLIKMSEVLKADISLTGAMINDLKEILEDDVA